MYGCCFEPLTLGINFLPNHYTEGSWNVLKDDRPAKQASSVAAVNHHIYQNVACTIFVYQGSLVDKILSLTWSELRLWLAVFQNRVHAQLTGKKNSHNPPLQPPLPPYLRLTCSISLITSGIGVSLHSCSVANMRHLLVMLAYAALLCCMFTNLCVWWNCLMYIYLFILKMGGVVKGRVIIGEKCLEGFLEGGDVGEERPKQVS